jgi:hypothetical protein
MGAGIRVEYREGTAEACGMDSASSGNSAGFAPGNGDPHAYQYRTFRKLCNGEVMKICNLLNILNIRNLALFVNFPLALITKSATLLIVAGHPPTRTPT